MRTVSAVMPRLDYYTLERYPTITWSNNTSSGRKSERNAYE